jgi:hypothetical protein
MGPPPFLWRDPNVLQAPESLRPIFQEAIDSGDLSEHAESLLLFLNLPREDREGVAPPPPPEEGEGILRDGAVRFVFEELMWLFKAILEDEDLPEDAWHYLGHLTIDIGPIGIPSRGPVGLEPQPSQMPRPGVGRVGFSVGPVNQETENQGEHMGGPGGAGPPPGPPGPGPRAELPEEVREQLRAIREMYREAMKIERDIRGGGGEPSEDVLSARNEIVQQIVDSVVDLLDAEVDNQNAPQLMRFLGASFGPKNWRPMHIRGGPGGGQGGQRGMGR